ASRSARFVRMTAASSSTRIHPNISMAFPHGCALLPFNFRIPRHCPLSPASLSQTNLVKAHERECFGNIAALGAVLRLSPIGRATPIVGMEGQGYFQARLGKALRPIHLRRFNHSVAVPHSSLRIPARSG